MSTRLVECDICREPAITRMELVEVTRLDSGRMERECIHDADLCTDCVRWLNATFRLLIQRTHYPVRSGPVEPNGLPP
jgi:hypothetical protein